MKSKRSNEGYFLLDHSNSPGLDPSVIKSIDGDLPTNIGRCKFEAPTYTCSHCCRVVVLNPLRLRERGYCSKCDHYVCDECNAVRIATGVCKTWREIGEEIINAELKTQSTKTAEKGGETDV